MGKISKATIIRSLEQVLDEKQKVHSELEEENSSLRKREIVLLKQVAQQGDNLHFVALAALQLSVGEQQDMPALAKTLMQDLEVHELMGMLSSDSCGRSEGGQDEPFTTQRLRAAVTPERVAAMRQATVEEVAATLKQLTMRMCMVLAAGTSKAKYLADSIEQAVNDYGEYGLLLHVVADWVSLKIGTLNLDTLEEQEPPGCWWCDVADNLELEPPQIQTLTTGFYAYQDKSKPIIAALHQHVRSICAMLNSGSNPETLPDAQAGPAAASAVPFAAAAALAGLKGLSNDADADAVAANADADAASVDEQLEQQLAAAALEYRSQGSNSTATALGWADSFNTDSLPLLPAVLPAAGSRNGSSTASTSRTAVSVAAAAAAAAAVAAITGDCDGQPPLPPLGGSSWCGQPSSCNCGSNSVTYNGCNGSSAAKPWQQFGLSHGGLTVESAELVEVHMQELLQLVMKLREMHRTVTWLFLNTLNARQHALFITQSWPWWSRPLTMCQYIAEKMGGGPAAARCPSSSQGGHAARSWATGGGAFEGGRGSHEPRVKQPSPAPPQQRQQQQQPSPAVSPAPSQQRQQQQEVRVAMPDKAQQPKAQQEQQQQENQQEEQQHAADEGQQQQQVQVQELLQQQQLHQHAPAEGQQPHAAEEGRQQQQQMLLQELLQQQQELQQQQQQQEFQWLCQALPSCTSIDAAPAITAGLGDMDLTSCQQHQDQDGDCSPAAKQETKQQGSGSVVSTCMPASVQQQPQQPQQHHQQQQKQKQPPAVSFASYSGPISGMHRPAQAGLVPADTAAFGTFLAGIQQQQLQQLQQQQAAVPVPTCQQQLMHSTF